MTKLSKSYKTELKRHAAEYRHVKYINYILCKIWRVRA